MSHQHHAPDYYTALHFTAEDIGKIYLFRNRFDSKLYSFELLDCVSMSLKEINEQLHQARLRPRKAGRRL